MLEVLISLKFKRLFPETYAIGNDESDIATWKKILEIKHQAHKHFLPDADNVWVGEASEYYEEDEDENDENTGYALIGRMADNYEDKGDCEHWNELHRLIGDAIDASPHRERIMRLATDDGILESEDV